MIGVVILGGIYFAHHIQQPAKPSLAEKSTPKFLNIQHWQTKKGARVLFVAAQQNPMVATAVIFNAGSSRDGRLFGLANYTNHMLAEGSAGLTAQKISADFDQVGASFSVSTNRDMAILSLKTLTIAQYYRPAIDLFSKVISQPNFAVKPFKRVKNQLLVAVKHGQQRPQKVLGDQVFQAIYASQPYGHPTLGSQKTIHKIRRTDVQRFYRRYYVAKNATIIIVGDVTLKQAKQLSEKISQPLRTGKEAAPLKTAKKNKPSNHQLNFPSTQTHIAVVGLGSDYKMANRLDLMVGAHILGGGMNSRLYRIIREENGLAYSVGSYFSPLFSRGPFIVNLQTRATQADKALKLTQQTLNHFIQEGPTAKEVADAKANIIQGFPFRLSSNQSIVHLLTIIGFYHLPMDYLDRYRDKVNAVSVASIKHAFSSMVHKDKLSTITLGPHK